MPRQGAINPVWLLTGGVGILLVVALATGARAAGSALILAGLAGLGMGGYAMVRGRLPWARIASRKAAGGVLAVGFVLAVVGGASTPTPPVTPAVGANEVTAASTPAVSTPAVSTPVPPTPVATSSPTPSSPVGVGERAIQEAQPRTALAVLGTLVVKGRAAKTGYSRTEFGQVWADADRNGCDTRNDVLRRDLTGYVLKEGTRGCTVLRGTLRDPYTGTTIRFVRGPSTSTAVQIDHVVALSDAWQKGAQSWPLTKRVAFANDSLNLLAVSGSANMSKSDGDAATWLPPVRAYRCAYVARQVGVKVKYGLWITPAEREATGRVLAGCPSLLVPTAKRFTLGGGTVQAAPPESATRKPAASGTDPDMGTCKAAKAAGYGPYYRGRDVEYGWYRDGDSDGVVCE